MREKTRFLIILLLLASGLSFSQTPAERLLSQTENAYNPIPNPDGTKIAYVHTGWRRPGGSGGLGRSNLVSEVKVMDKDGRILTEKPLSDTFLAGWTPDGKNLICYRDHQYFLISPSGERSKEAQVHPVEPTSWIDKSERGTYIRSIDAMLFVEHLWNPPRGVIRTADKEVIRNNDAEIGDMLVPSPDERYIAAVDVNRAADNFLWVYDTQNRTWVNLGKASAHPGVLEGNNDWDWRKATWNPWFADSSRIAFLSGDSVVVSTPDGKDKRIVNLAVGPKGLPTPSPDGKLIAYVSYEGMQSKVNAQVTLWRDATVWVVPVLGGKARAVSEPSPQTIYTLRWLNNDEIVFDRSPADDWQFLNVRLWKVNVRVAVR